MKEKVFILNRQKTGTTSIGDFFEAHGFKRAGWNDARSPAWSKLWYEGRHEEVMKDEDFMESDVFEDWPWFHRDVPEIVSSRHPDARFILVYRDPDDWFRSLRKHVHRKGGFKIPEHQVEYDDEQSLNSGEIASSLKAHYQKIYLEHIGSVLSFFRKNPQFKFFFGSLKDPRLFAKLASFVEVDYHGEDYHSNADPRKGRKQRIKDLLTFKK